MTSSATPVPAPATTPSTTAPPHTATDEPELVAEDLVEEVSIDGMCGVY